MINVDGETEDWYYYYADALGSIRLMTDASGYPVVSYTGACPERSRGNPYGMPYVMTAAGADNNWLTEDVSISQTSSIGNPYLFTARRWEGSCRLYYYRFRDGACPERQPREPRPGPLPADRPGRLHRHHEPLRLLRQ